MKPSRLWGRESLPMHDGGDRMVWAEVGPLWGPGSDQKVMKLKRKIKMHRKD